MTSDVFSKAKRSEIMSRIRGRGNRTTELVLVKLFRDHGVTGWRRHRDVFGRPDFIFRQQKVAVFVDGCFWHGCPKHCRMPKSRHVFWEPKIFGNKKRDRVVNRQLALDGWRVVRIWEHALSKPARALARIKTVLAMPVRYR